LILNVNHLTQLLMYSGFSPGIRRATLQVSSVI
jgi:hypothetical protein